MDVDAPPPLPDSQTAERHAGAQGERRRDPSPWRLSRDERRARRRGRSPSPRHGDSRDEGRDGRRHVDEGRDGRRHGDSRERRRGDSRERRRGDSRERRRGDSRERRRGDSRSPQRDRGRDGYGGRHDRSASRERAHGRSRRRSRSRSGDGRRGDERRRPRHVEHQRGDHGPVQVRGGRGPAWAFGTRWWRGERACPCCTGPAPGRGIVDGPRTSLLDGWGRKACTRVRKGGGDDDTPPPHSPRLWMPGSCSCAKLFWAAHAPALTHSPPSLLERRPPSPSQTKWTRRLQRQTRCEPSWA